MAGLEHSVPSETCDSSRIAEVAGSIRDKTHPSYSLTIQHGPFDMAGFQHSLRTVSSLRLSVLFAPFFCCELYGAKSDRNS